MPFVIDHTVVSGWHLGALPIAFDRQTAPPREMLALALRFGLSSYDAAYLELALRRQLPIATQDADLQVAAVAAGVGVFNG
jgi:predicted nucleic acid-binding protein